MRDPIKFNPGKIPGGDWASSTPAWCEVECRLGVLPGKSVQVAKQEIIACFAEATNKDAFLFIHSPEVICDGFRAEGSVLEPSDAEVVLGHAHRIVFGRDMGERLSTAVDDSRFTICIMESPRFAMDQLAQDSMASMNVRAYRPCVTLRW